MEIKAKTDRYTAQELQQALKLHKPVVLGGEQPGEYIIAVDNDNLAKLVRSMLDHIGVEHDEQEGAEPC